MFATVDNIATDVMRELDPAEKKRATQLLDDALNLIEGRIPDMRERAVLDMAFRGIVKVIQRNAVCRVLRNPEGLDQESEGEYTAHVSMRVASGVMEIMPKEWKQLGLDTGTAFFSFDAWRFQ